jgi:mannose-6-phosphate isomerase-like protein (cupin superfamily)
VLVHLDQGETIRRTESRELLTVLAEPDLTITWNRHRPGEAGTDLHVHREHVDAFYVLEGELSFDVGPDAERISLGPGGFVAVPPNVVHLFVNAGNQETQWLNFHAPDGGFAQYLRDGTGFDSFDPPADGGLPLSELVVARLLPRPGIGVLPYLWVTENDAEDFGAYNLVLGDDRYLTVRAPAG